MCRGMTQPHKGRTQPPNVQPVGATDKDLSSSTEALEAADLPKTTLCEKWLWGGCELAPSMCPFAHGVWELKSTINFKKTSYCRAWLRGHCKMGAKCRHAHGTTELNFGQPQDAPEVSPGCAPQVGEAHTSQSNASGLPNNCTISKTLMSAAVWKALQVISVQGGSLTDFTSILCAELQVTRENLKAERKLIAECLKSCGFQGQFPGQPPNSSDVTRQLMRSTMKPALGKWNRRQYQAPMEAWQTAQQQVHLQEQARAGATQQQVDAFPLTAVVAPQNMNQTARALQGPPGLFDHTESHQRIKTKILEGPPGLSSPLKSKFCVHLFPSILQTLESIPEVDERGIVAKNQIKSAY